MIADNYYTVKQFAKAQGISRMTVCRWINQGDIPCERAGRVGLIPKTAIKPVCPTCGQYERRQNG